MLLYIDKPATFMFLITIIFQLDQNIAPPKRKHYYVFAGMNVKDSTYDSVYNITQVQGSQLQCIGDASTGQVGRLRNIVSLDGSHVVDSKAI